MLALLQAGKGAVLYAVHHHIPLEDVLDVKHAPRLPLRLSPERCIAIRTA